ncbi:MAG TPA: DEAD/DEAH box helicase [Bryobacteraceae bacterium]|nr:DEAD/DEAH box helicase [Bryobacteraceae bacterium]
MRLPVQPTHVSVKDGRIQVVPPSLADLLLMQRLGGRWGNLHRAWLWPATEGNARKLLAKLRAIQTTPEFDALISGTGAIVPPPPATGALVTAPSSAPVVVPEVVIPEPDIIIPGILTPLWRHQRAAFRFCMDRFGAGMHGLLLAMGMGTGKSLVACALALTLAARKEPRDNPFCMIVACPLRVIQVWQAQFARHVGIPVVIVALDEDAGSVAQKRELAAEKMKLARARNVPFVAVVNYDSAWREPFASWAESLFWDLVIADEAHRLKTPGGKASMEFKRLRTRASYRLALTGTPMPHGPMDIYAVFRFLDISILGPSFSAFRQKYAVMGGYQRKQITGYQNIEELERLMGRITFRVGPEVLDLPPATEVTYHCALTGEAARIYKDLDEDFVARVKDGTVTAANAMVKLLRLQQVTGGCVPTDDGGVHRIDSSKLKLLADTLEDIGKEEPVVVFCRFHADLDAVHKACEQNGYSSMELSGRRDELRRWQNGEAQVLAVQIESGSEGVEFVRARYSIFYSIGFRLEKYEQAKKRTHRPGQERPVTHIHLVARNTVDVKVIRALAKRQDIVESILAEIKN